MLLKYTVCVILGMGVGMACTPSGTPVSPTSEESSSPEVGQVAGEAADPFCCDGCEYTEGTGLRCVACDPIASDDVCEREKVECGDNSKSWDESTRELACADTPSSTVTVSPS